MSLCILAPCREPGKVDSEERDSYVQIMTLEEERDSLRTQMIPIGSKGDPFVSRQAETRDPGRDSEVEARRHQLVQNVSVANRNVIRHVRRHQRISVIPRDVDVGDWPFRCGFP